MIITPKVYQTSRIAYYGGIGEFDVEIIAFGNFNEVKVTKVEPVNAKEFEVLSITPTEGRLHYPAFTVKAKFKAATEIKNTRMSSFAPTVAAKVYFEIDKRRYYTIFKTIGYDAPWEYKLDIKGTPKAQYPDRVYLADGGLFLLDTLSCRTHQDFVEFVKVDEIDNKSGLQFACPKYGLPADGEPYELTVQVPKGWEVPEYAKTEAAEDGFTKVILPVHFIQTGSFSKRFNEYIYQGKALEQVVDVIFYVKEGSRYDEGK